MSVYKPKRSKYWSYDFRWKGRRFHGSTGCKSKREALAVEANIRAEAVMPTRTREPLSLDQAAGLYAEHAEHLPSWAGVEGILKAMLKALGKGKLLSEVTQRDLQGWLARLRDGRSNATVNRYLDTARSVWKRADKARFDVGEMPDWKALRLKVPRRAPRELSADEEAKLMPAAHDLRDDGSAAACDYALKSGWRAAEVIGLRWSDCDFQTMQAVTRIKGGDYIKRPLTAALVAIIANQPRVGPFVFTYVCKRSWCGKRQGQRVSRLQGQRYPLTVTVLRAAMAAAKKAAGVENFRFHDFRHTRGTRITRTHGLAAAQRALAHRSINSTLVYAHVLDEDLRNALDGSDPVITPAAQQKKDSA